LAQRVVYPDVYQEDLRASVREFYDKFYRIKLSDKQLEALVRRAEAQPGETRRPIDVPLLGAEPVPLPGPSPVPQGRPPGRGSPLPSRCPVLRAPAISVFRTSPITPSQARMDVAAVAERGELWGERRDGDLGERLRGPPAWRCTMRTGRICP